MKPMSEIVSTEVNNSSENLESDAVDTIIGPTKTLSDNENEKCEIENLSVDQNNEEQVRNTDTVFDGSGVEDTENESGKNIEKQDSLENNKTEFSTDESNRQESLEIKSPLPAWSYSQWSENYESLEDDRPVEDLNGDPKKLILWAAEKNELETMRKLLEEDPSLVNVRDNDLYTPLHRASYSNNIEVIKMLLSYDADINSKTTDDWQALHCACKWDSVEAVSLLLQNGADVNAQTKGHITPLHLAASNANGRRTLELLLWQPHIQPNVKNDAGDTAYDIAFRTGPLGALFEILEESVNIY